MPTFDFSLKSVKTQKRKTSQNHYKREVIVKDVKGIIWIDTNAEYSVRLDDGSQYAIHPNCYSCKGHNRIYRRGVSYKERYIYIRTLDNCVEQNRIWYLPFDVGCIVRGNIIKILSNNVKYFVIKQCWTELDNLDSHAALMFYKEHIDTINDIIRKQLMG